DDDVEVRLPVVPDVSLPLGSNLDGEPRTPGRRGLRWLDPECRLPVLDLLHELGETRIARTIRHQAIEVKFQAGALREPRVVPDGGVDLRDLIGLRRGEVADLTLPGAQVLLDVGQVPVRIVAGPPEQAVPRRPAEPHGDLAEPGEEREGLLRRPAAIRGSA